MTLKLIRFILFSTIFSFSNTAICQNEIEISLENGKSSYTKTLVGKAFYDTIVLFSTLDSLDYIKCSISQKKEYTELIFSDVLKEGDYENLGLTVKVINKQGLIVENSKDHIVGQLVGGGDTLRINSLVRNFSSNNIDFRKKIITNLKYENSNFFTPNITALIEDSIVLPGVSDKIIVLKSENLKAGKYVGNVLLIDEYNNETSIPTTLNVKHGILWPLLVLCLGLVIGFFTKVYNDNKDIIDLYEKANLLLNQLDDNDTLELKVKVNSFINKLLLSRLYSITELEKEFQALVKEYKELKSSYKTKVFDNDKTFIQSLKGLWLFSRVVGPALILFSALILALIVFQKFYINNDVFGQNPIIDYITLLLAGAASTTTMTIIFGKKYSELKT